MGASQSDQGGKSSQQRSKEVKTSYYELLGVERQATDEEIKKAYRRKALELHPDRNYGDVERATTLFAEISTAYEVLSDPQERAWYDSHEDAILRDVDLDAGDSPEAYERNIGLTTADDITRMLRKFHGGVEFTDAPSAFFGFLRETFATLAKEEEVAARRDGATSVDYPSFGHQDDEYEDVVKQFYAVWNGFATRKTFAWRDKYRSSDAPDRRTRRYIEKENQQFRQEGIREFNDAVRTLVSFVRRRDPRYKPNTQSEIDRERVLREAAAARAAKMRAEHTAKMDAEVLPEWAKFREKEELEESSDDESEEEQFECVACRKTFKSERQFEAHEKSKKHVKAVYALRKQLQKEGKALDLDDDDGEEESAVATPASEDADRVQLRPDVNHDTGSDLDDGVGSVRNHHEPPGGDVLNTAKQHLDFTEQGGVSGSKNSDSPPSTVFLAGAALQDPTAAQDQANSTLIPPDNIDSDDPTSQAESIPKLGKAAQKRAKKAAATATAQADEAQHKCATCSAPFPSKSRLFQHIKDHGHAAPLPAGKAKGVAKGRK